MRQEITVHHGVFQAKGSISARADDKRDIHINVVAQVPYLGEQNRTVVMSFGDTVKTIAVLTAALEQASPGIMRTLTSVPQR